MGDSGEVHSWSTSSTAEAKAEMRQWLDRWKLVGQVLDDERWSRLRAASDADLKRQALDLLGLWQPGLSGDDGEAQLLHQRAFALLRDRDKA